jgi:hypothetical protein
MMGLPLAAPMAGKKSLQRIAPRKISTIEEGKKVPGIPEGNPCAAMLSNLLWRMDTKMFEQVFRRYIYTLGSYSSHWNV